MVHSDHDTTDLTRWGQIGALESWARTEDRTARTAPGREAFLARFDDYPDPEAARKAYFKRLALKSAQARRKTADATTTAPPTGTADALTDITDVTRDDRSTG